MVNIVDTVRCVILSLQADGLGLHPKIDILGYQYGPVEGFLLGDAISRVQNLVIDLTLMERFLNIIMDKTMDSYAYLTGAFAYLDAAARRLVAEQLINAAKELSRVPVDRFPATFKIIELFDYHYGNDNVVLIELVQALTVMKNHISV